MNALVLTLFVGACLMAYGLVQFVGAWQRREHEQSDRLSLLPLADDEASALPSLVPALAGASSPSPIDAASPGEQP